MTTTSKDSISTMLTTLPGGQNGKLRLLISDGVKTSQINLEGLSVSNLLPKININTGMISSDLVVGSKIFKDQVVIRRNGIILVS